MLDFKNQSSIVNILGALLIIFVLLYILQYIVMSFQTDYFLSTDYTVDCTTGLIKPTGSAAVIPTASQTKTQILKGESPRYEFLNGNIVDTRRNYAKVGTIPSTCSTYEFNDEGVWGPASSRDTRGSTYNYIESESPLLDSQMTDAQQLDWLNSIYNTNEVTSTAGGSTTTSSGTRRLTGISPNTGGSGRSGRSGSTTGTTGTGTTGTGTTGTGTTGTGTTGTGTTTGTTGTGTTGTGAAAGSGTGTSLNYVSNAGLKPALSTCKQYYNVGWH
jgi:hypothetical protein